MTVTAVMTVVEVMILAAVVVTMTVTPTLPALMLPALPVRLATPTLVVDVLTKAKHAAAPVVLLAARIGTLAGKVSPFFF
jgi:uncharacterized membrane protein